MVFDRADLAMRLIEERTKKGYSQASFARELGISREGLRKYEMGQTGLSAEVLAKAAGLGVDVQYVLTGVYSKNVDETTKNTSPILNINDNGSANVIQFANSGSTINQINTQKHVTKVTAEVIPGEKHITEEQAVTLQKLVKEVVELENSSGRKQPRTHQAVWSALNSHCKVSRYRLIAKEDFTKAETYLRQWIGRLSRLKSAPKSNNSEWRKRKYAYIKINTSNANIWLTNYLASRFGVSSITELSDENLGKLYNAVAAKKRKK
ncbi:helix-turn-helix domain-containing protein [Shewanella sp. AS1]|uniref:helix-turn-helix domain-containing protein n=1 Tax=Shewanella sp. AS1 TaxID=2907626 RepID=UPI001F2D8735|nr:helix-turn-helix transcriptional regulator [Shewanella sp. AS1]MCE9679582.1 helix-turn-helix domain-containing protein [Shewanella sp. AS1]